MAVEGIFVKGGKFESKTKKEESFRKLLVKD
jgi:hypothetical protein